MNIEKMREEFEAWAATKKGGLVAGDFRWMESRNRYYYEITQAMWESWQASREALVIELPAIDDPDCGQRVSFHLGAYKGECRQAIEAAGVKVKL